MRYGRVSGVIGCEIVDKLFSRVRLEEVEEADEETEPEEGAEIFSQIKLDVKKIVVEEGSEVFGDEEEVEEEEYIDVFVSSDEEGEEDDDSD